MKVNDYLGEQGVDVTIISKRIFQKERERERESVCVCVCVCAAHSGFVWFKMEFTQELL